MRRREGDWRCFVWGKEENCRFSDGVVVVVGSTSSTVAIDVSSDNIPVPMGVLALIRRVELKERTLPPRSLELSLLPDSPPLTSNDPLYSPLFGRELRGR